MDSPASASSVTESRKKMRLADETAVELSADEVVAIIFSFLPPMDILCLSQVCLTWRDAAKKALVPLNEFEVDSVRSYNAMRAMSTILPNLQQLSLRTLEGPGKYSDGEDPDEEGQARTADWTSYDIYMISNFSKLRILEILGWCLNGIYPVLFNFSLLQKLSIKYCRYLKWDLEMLEGLPRLKELDCSYNAHLTGNLSSLRVLKDTLENVNITVCPHVEGNFMDLADFPHLKVLDLRKTGVRGDIRDIGEHHFPALKYLYLPKTVVGGRGYQFQLVAEVPEFMQAIHLLLQRSPTIFRYGGLPSSWALSKDSPDYYDRDVVIERLPTHLRPLFLAAIPHPPFRIRVIRAGSRLGWSWCTKVIDGIDYSCCDINWLDPEPSSESDDYEVYIQDLQRINNEWPRRYSRYRGYHQPPTEEEYRRLMY